MPAPHPHRGGPGLGRRTTCRSCQAPICFGRTPAGLLIPLDIDDAGRPRLEVKADGTRIKPNVAVVDGFAVVLKADELALETTEPTHVPHHATCPHVADYRPPTKAAQ